MAVDRSKVGKTTKNKMNLVKHFPRKNNLHYFLCYANKKQIFEIASPLKFWLIVSTAKESEELHMTLKVVV